MFLIELQNYLVKTVYDKYQNRSSSGRHNGLWAYFSEDGNELVSRWLKVECEVDMDELPDYFISGVAMLLMEMMLKQCQYALDSELRADVGSARQIAR